MDSNRTSNSEQQDLPGNRLRIRYDFGMAGGAREAFDLDVDTDRMELVNPLPDELPFWTLLEFNQCPHCPLQRQSSPHCPAAKNLLFPMEFSKHFLSYETVTITVDTRDRQVVQEVPVQRALSSLMGLLMATSACPFTAKFKPMARFHLPLANTQETMYRAMSMYLVGQYFRKQNGQDADLELEGLLKIYEDIHKVNRSMAKRLRDSNGGEALINAISVLDVFAQMFPIEFKNELKSIRMFFEDYLAPDEAVAPSDVASESEVAAG